MSNKNNITGDTIVSKSSFLYSENYDKIFRSSKVIYHVTYNDESEATIEFANQNEANKFYEKNHETILKWASTEVLLG